MRGLVAARSLHQTAAPARQIDSQRQLAQAGSNQLSLETPRNTVGMYFVLTQNIRCPPSTRW